MNSLIARFGQLETRRAAQTFWGSGKRKRAERLWTCTECRRNSRQKRLYSDATLRWNGLDNLSVEREGGEAETRKGWGLDRNAGPAARRTSELDWTSNDAAGQRQGALDTFFTHREPSTSTNPSTTEAASDDEQNAMWERFEADGLVGSAVDATPKERLLEAGKSRRAGFRRNNAMQDVDYKTVFPQALAKREVDLVARCLFTAESKRDTDFIASISEATFSDVLQLLQPKNFMLNLASAHVELSASVAKKLNLAPMRLVAFEYASMLQQLFLIRRSKGVKLSLQDYTTFLRGARDLGDREMGLMMWHSLHEDGHRPDTACYNHFMATIVWNRVHDARLRRRVRVIPFHMKWRQRTTSEDQDYRVGSGGVRERTLSLFNQMLQQGVAADQDTFLILITAAAREGNLDTVKSLLKTVWTLDVDALLSESSEGKVKPRKFPADSPLRPTPELLFVLAHAFAINNDIPSALRVTDFVARYYSIAVTERAWKELFEWTFALAINRGGTSREDGSKAGELPKQSPMRLWETMTSAPYHVQPSMGMYNLLITNFSRRKATPWMYEKMEEAYEIYETDRALANKSRKRLQGVLKERHIDPDVSLETLRMQWEQHDLIRRRDVFWLKRWLRLLLSTLSSWNRVDSSEQFITQRLPSLLWYWRDMAPTTVRYEMASGLVEFKIREEESMLRNAEHVQSVRLVNHRLRNEAPRFIGQSWFEVKPPAPSKQVISKFRYVQTP